MRSLKLNISRRKIIFYLSEGAASAHDISLGLKVVRSTINNNLKWLRRCKIVEFRGAWSLTPAGRHLLQVDPTLKQEVPSVQPRNFPPSGQLSVS